MPSLRQCLLALALVGAAAAALSLVRVDDGQLRQVTAARAAREGLTEAASGGALGRRRLVLGGDPAFHDTLRQVARTTPGLELADDGAPYALHAAEDAGAVKVFAAPAASVPPSASAPGGAALLAEGRLPAWTALLPPVVAILLALVLRRILLALFLAVWAGACLHNGADPVTGLWLAGKDYLYGNLVNSFNVLIFAFTFSLVGMVGVATRMGGIHGLVDAIARHARTRRSTQLATTGLGVAVFFDDYANTVVVGTTMRNLTDRMGISREKLSYIVDSTSAPIAGVAVISTWIGYEVEQLDQVARFVGLQTGGYALFFELLPYRFYCLFTLLFMVLMCVSGRDFGPMLAAERRAAAGQPLREGSRLLVSKAFAHIRPADGAPLRWWNAVIPVGVVIGTTFAGMLWVGADSSHFAGDPARAFSLLSFTDWKDAFIGVGEIHNGGPAVLAGSAAAGSLVAIALALGQRILRVREALSAWLGGARVMILANSVLLMAWAIRSVCDDVGTSLYLAAALHGVVSAVALPLIVFLLASAVAFATGTSWGTMGILLPTVGPMAFALGDHTILVLCLGAVLDGAIFGDHCSPISDTTVLSSISSAVDHVDHVRTQLPYALTCMVAAGLSGYLWVASGGPVLVGYLLGAALLIAALWLLGRRPGEGAPA